MTQYERDMLEAYRERTRVIGFALRGIGFGDGKVPGCLEMIAISIGELVAAFKEFHCYHEDKKK